MLFKFILDIVCLQLFTIGIATEFRVIRLEYDYNTGLYWKSDLKYPLNDFPVIEKKVGVENVPSKRRCLEDISNIISAPCPATEFQSSTISLVGGCERRTDSLINRADVCSGLSFISGTSLSCAELLLYSLMRTSFRVSTFSKHHSLSSYNNISSVISKVLGVNFSAGAIRSYFPRVSKNLLKRNIGKENGQVRWSFFKKETEEFLATASEVLKASLNDPSNLTDCNLYMLSVNLKMICSQSLQRHHEVEICFDATFPEQFHLFSKHHSPRLSNWTPWYNSVNETIHLYSFQQTPGYADKEIILCKDGKWNFRSEGYDRNASDVNVFVPLPDQIIRMKSLIKLLEIIDECKMCNGCGLTERYGHLISEGETLFKKKDGRDGVVFEKLWKHWGHPTVAYF